MPTTFINEQKYSGQTPITYGEAGKTYGESGYIYSGKIGTTYNNQTKN